MLDSLVSALLKEMAKILYEEARQEVKLVTGVGGEINTLKSNLESIHALLDDAEERQFNQKSIQLWLDRLKDVCYDMEDVLDEWNTALLKLRLVDGGVQIGKVHRPFIPCFSFGQVVHRRDIALKIKETNKKLDEIAKEKDRYGLVPRDAIRQPSRSAETTSFTEVSKLQGRDDVKKDLVTRLLCDSSDPGESNNVKAISVVGMGGIGKTALAQLVYNDNEVGSHFDRRKWICVSDVYDVGKIAREISVSLQAPPLDGLEPLQRLLEICCKFIAGKKVLLVLDDVWTEDNKKWEPIKQIFKHAAPGSRILVTTRKDTVVRGMMELGSVYVCRLEQLSEEVCWKIFSQHAFTGKDQEQCRVLEDIGRKIAKRCEGLPLAAKTLGCLMRSKKTREQWEQILNSELWKLDSVQEDVFVPLLLSYYDLPSAIRRCFLYCSVFPKDSILQRDQLIHLWMAHSYISSSEYAEMEVTGREYFECLLDRSLLQIHDQFCQRDVDGSVYFCRMHDLVHDFALFLTKGEIVIKEASEDSIVEFPECARHLSINAEASVQKMTSLASSGGAEKLRSLAIFRRSSLTCKSNLDFHTLLDGSKLLRSFEFNSTYYGATDSKSFPEETTSFTEVSKLVHLRLLRLSSLQCTITRLPEAVCELFNLQTLKLILCKGIKKLPDGIGNLINLRHLNINGCDALAYYPKGIGKLTSLRELRGVRATGEIIDDEKFSVGDLENLCHLRVLRLSVVGCRINANEARRAKLQDKAHLKTLELGLYAHVDRNEATQLLNPPSHAPLFPFILESKLRNLFHTVLTEACGRMLGSSC